MTVPVDIPQHVASAHLTRDQLERLACLLADERGEQRAKLDEHEAAAASTSGEDRDLAEVLAGRTSETLDELDTAIARLEAGEYGVCTSCGAPIPFERLEAVPHALLCVACHTAPRAGRLSGPKGARRPSSLAR